MKINVLEPKIYNRIAAGEVVDSPRSVVKEIFENSIDAGASSVSIEIKDGGISYIKITDNGGGIERGEMEKVFLPHATSKISSLEDLSHIATLGFRGEAIASIASVAKISVSSRTQSDDLGYYMVYENGEKIEEGDKGCPLGTTVIIENLFKNIPARAKFLKAPKSEEADITTLIGKLILTNPNVSIKYSVEEKVVYSSTGEGLESALICVYGRGILDNLMPISLSMPGINITGYVNKPAYTKHNKTFQTLSVNNRYVISDEVGYAVFYAYKDYLMTRQYPMFVINIDLPEDMVDVNVHPGKMEIKFVQSERIKRIIKNCIEEKIKELLDVPKNIVKANVNDDDIFAESPINLKDSSVGVAGSTVNSEENKDKVKRADEFRRDKDYGYGGKPAASPLNLNERPFSAIIKDIKPINPGRYEYGYSSSMKDTPNLIKNDDFAEKSHTMTDINSEFFTQEAYKDILDASLESRRIGKIFNTYLLIQTENELLLIDQHAAHERILYDRLLSQVNGNLDIQDLLVPYVFEVNFREHELIENNIFPLKECGFELEEYSGNAFCLRSVPAVLDGINLKEFVGNLVEILDSGKLKRSEFAKSAIMQCACKAAIKGDMDLSDFDVSYIMEQLKSTKELFCPHGRPIVIKISKTEIEKWFKRIV